MYSPSSQRKFKDIKLIILNIYSVNQKKELSQMKNRILTDELKSYSSFMFQDNKGMVTPAQSERPPSQSVHVNITDPDKTQTRATTLRCRRRLRVPYLLNAFIAVFGKS